MSQPGDETPDGVVGEGASAPGPPRGLGLLDDLPLPAVAIDPEGRLRYANDAFRSLAGLAGGELVGESWLEALVPEHARPDARRVLDAVAAGGAPAGHRHPVRTLAGDERLVAWASVMTRDPGGQPSGVLSVGHVVDAHPVPGAPHDSEVRYRAIVDLAVDAIVSIDTAGTIESFNRAAERMFGWRAEEVLGRNVTVLMPSPYRDEHDHYLAEYLRTRVPRIIGRGREVVGRRRDGGLFPMDLAVSEVVLGDRLLFTGIVRDITERRRAEQLASIGTLASALAHEIGTPLNVILGRAEFIRGQVSGDLGRGLDIIVGQVERVTRLMNQLLTLTRRGPMDPRPTSVAGVVESTLEVLGDRIRRRSIRLATDLAPDLPRVMSDPDRLSQVVLNLVLNAVDAMPGGGELAVSAALAPARGSGPPHVRLRVADTGTGIAPEIAARIFDAFFTTKEPGKGTGLGLAVVLGIVRDHGGDVQVQSQPGKGSTFDVLLPVRPPRA